MNVECEHDGKIRLVSKNAAVKASIWQGSPRVAFKFQE